MSALPEDWDQQALSDLVDKERGICYGIVQPGSHAANGVPVIRVNNIKFGRIETGDALRVSNDIEARYRRSRLRGGEVLLTLVGSLGESAVVPTELAGWNVARAVGVIPVRPEIGSRWVELCLRSSLSQNFIGTRATTTVQATFNLRDLANIPIPLPPKKERDAIASVLGSLDDKIELNRRMNETLEALAQSLFKSWFVDFDPIRAKGGRFKDSPLGKIPEDWSVSRLKAFTTKIGSGATPRGGNAVYVDEGVALIRSQNVYDHEFHWDGLARLTDESAAELQGVEVKREDVLFNITGDSILRTCVVDPDVLPARVNQHVVIIRAAPGIPSRFLHLFLVQPRMKYFLGGLNAGATRQAVTKAQLELVEVLNPPNKVLDQFATTTEPLFRRIESNRSESRTLAALRDALLPKLLSGELRVPQLPN